MRGIGDIIAKILGLKDNQSGSLEAHTFTFATGNSEESARAKLEAALPAAIGSGAYAVQPSVEYTKTDDGVTAIATYRLKPYPTDKPVRPQESAVLTPGTGWTPSALDSRTPEPLGYNSK